MRKALKITVLTVAALFIAFAALGATLDQTSAPTKSEKVTSEPSNGSAKGSVPECENEDGSGSEKPCYWDGGQNGKGSAYVIKPNGEMVNVDTGEKIKR